MAEHQINVMIVEDDEMTINIYRKFIDKLDGFQLVASAGTGKQAIELLQAFTPHLILLDVFLPDMKGTDLLWEIRKEVRGVDIIMITAANDTYTVSEAMRGGAFSYMMKPIMIDQFLSTLQHYQQTREKIMASTTVEQIDVNHFFGMKTEQRKTVNPEISNSLPKGVDKHTLKKVREQLKVISKSINAEEMAAAIGASVSTVRRYLEYLVSKGELEVEIIYGTVGRPERRYEKK